jgi:hypothetical protein
MTGPLAACARATVLGVERAALAKAGEGCVGGVGDDEDITTAPSVTAVRPTIGNVLLVAEGDSSAPA